jgi:hypothetical protein
MANKFNSIFKRDRKLDTDQLIFKKTVISFSFFILFIIGAIGGWKWIRHRPNMGGKTNAPLRAVMDMNERIFNGFLSSQHLAKSYPISEAANPARVNGNIGLQSALDSMNWAMHVIRAPGDTINVKLEDLKKLPKTEIVFNFKCIEGWNQVTYWGGVRFSDFMKAYELTTEEALNYLGLATPDKQYYVGIDMASALHPQTLLCYELNGQPLPLNQGYPVRLIIPVKYGVKSLKRIGYMYFSDRRPPDYWADRYGYDYYTGL